MLARVPGQLALQVKGAPGELADGLLEVDVLAGPNRGQGVRDVPGSRMRINSVCRLALVAGGGALAQPIRVAPANLFRLISVVVRQKTPVAALTKVKSREWRLAT
jgi:hypothetical protein